MGVGSSVRVFSEQCVKPSSSCSVVISTSDSWMDLASLRHVMYLERTLGGDGETPSRRTEDESINGVRKDKIL